MWERFSYYGMRALLVLFLTASLIDGGYGWERENALQLYALYTGLVYFTPLFGGMIADKVLGYRKAVIIGAFVMAFGHLCMALEIPIFFYIGLTALILGNGLFKPNISSMVGQLYDDPEQKDGAYTIFYMGINAGAFLGILLCGYIGEKVGWSYGFGLAMIFMIAGAIQFWLSGKIFGDIGLAPKKDTLADLDKPVEQTNLTNNNGGRLTKWVFAGVITAAVIYFVNPLKEFDSFLSTVNSAVMPSLILAAFVAIIGFIISDPSLTKIEKDRVWVIVILTGFTVFFWWAFEQAGGSMTIFAGDYTDRNLVGGQANVFNVINTLLTIVPMVVITWVLAKLIRVTYGAISMANIILAISFIIIWVIIILMLSFEWGYFPGLAKSLGLDLDPNKTQVAASWFGILNSFFIIALAPLFSKFWDMKIITSGPVKFAMGLLLLALGFAFLAWGSAGIPQGAKTASVSMVWLILAYLFHTLGELCLSPVGLSYISKLAPLRLIGIMFGVFFLSNFLANWAGGMTGSYIDAIVEKNSMSVFFLIFTVVPAVAALLLIILKPTLKRMMHGID
jgi:POT family proton-dependent oligopeptide transporter